MGVWLYWKKYLMIYFPTFRKIASENRHWQTDIRKRTCKKAKESCRGFLGCYRRYFGKVFYGGLTFQIGFFFKKENLLWGKDFLFMSESDCSSNMLDILSLIYLMFAVMFSMFWLKNERIFVMLSVSFNSWKTGCNAAIQRWQCQEQNREG